MARLSLEQDVAQYTYGPTPHRPGARHNSTCLCTTVDNSQWLSSVDAETSGPICKELTRGLITVVQIPTVCLLTIRSTRDDIKRNDDVKWLVHWCKPALLRRETRPVSTAAPLIDENLIHKLHITERWDISRRGCGYKCGISQKILQLSVFSEASSSHCYYYSTVHHIILCWLFRLGFVDLIY